MTTKLPTVDASVPLTLFQEIVGCLPWLAGCTCPNIAYATLYLAQSLVVPTKSLWSLAMGVVAYLVQTRTVGITLGGEKKNLEGYVDTDWAGCGETRRSTTGWVFMLNRLPIVWSSR
jgi:hypothetical protein